MAAMLCSSQKSSMSLFGNPPEFRQQYINPDPRAQVSRETLLLPDTLRTKTIGQLNTYMGQMAEALTVQRGNFINNSVVPRIYESNPQLRRGVVLDLHPALPRHAPEFSTAEHVTFSQREWTSSMTRFMLGMFMDDGVLATPQGQRHYVLGMAQIADGFDKLHALGSIRALLKHNIFSQLGPERPLGAVYDSVTLMEYLADTCRTFGRLNKQRDGIMRWMADAQSQMRLDPSADVPDTLLLPEGMETALQWRAENAGHVTRDNRPMVWSVLDSPAREFGTFHYNLKQTKVYSINPVHTARGARPYQPLSQQRTIGEWNVIRPPGTIKVADGGGDQTMPSETALKNMYSIKIYDHERDRLVVVRLSDILHKLPIWEEAKATTYAERPFFNALCGVTEDKAAEALRERTEVEKRAEAVATTPLDRLNKLYTLSATLETMIKKQGRSEELAKTMGRCLAAANDEAGKDKLLAASWMDVTRDADTGPITETLAHKLFVARCPVPFAVMLLRPNIVYNTNSAILLKAGAQTAQCISSDIGFAVERNVVNRSVEANAVAQIGWVVPKPQNISIGLNLQLLGHVSGGGGGVLNLNDRDEVATFLRKGHSGEQHGSAQMIPHVLAPWEVLDSPVMTMTGTLPRPLDDIASSRFAFFNPDTRELFPRSDQLIAALNGGNKRASFAAIFNNTFNGTARNKRAALRSNQTLMMRASQYEPRLTDFSTDTVKYCAYWPGQNHLPTIYTGVGADRIGKGKGEFLGEDAKWTSDPLWEFSTSPERAFLPSDWSDCDSV